MTSPATAITGYFKTLSDQTKTNLKYAGLTAVSTAGACALILMGAFAAKIDHDIAKENEAARCAAAGTALAAEFGKVMDKLPASDRTGRLSGIVVTLDDRTKTRCELSIAPQ